MAVVLLYNPRTEHGTFPLALLQLAAALRAGGHGVRIVDGRVEADCGAALLRGAEGADLLGVTVLSGPGLSDGRKRCEALRAQRPDLPIVWGGWHASLDPRSCFDCTAVDFVVAGAGEGPLLALLDCLRRGVAPGDVAGLSLRGGALASPVPPAAMPALSLAEFELVDPEDYFALKQRRQWDLVSSQGCPFDCAFCADPKVYGRRRAERPVAELAEELATFRRRWPFEDLSFQDETLCLDEKRFLDLSRMVAGLGPGLSWAGTMRADVGARLSEAAWGEAAASGLRRLLVGVETGAERIARILRKGGSADEVRATVAACGRHGIRVLASFIVGFPGEEDHEVAATLALAEELHGLHSDCETPIFSFLPYPGCEDLGPLVLPGMGAPRSLQDWEDFDFVLSHGPWVPRRTRARLRLFRRRWGRGHR